MHAIKKARRLIEADPRSESAKTLSTLVLSLEAKSEFQISRLYELDLKEFEVAMEVLRDWRIDRYYTNKAKLVDLSVMVKGLEPDAANPQAADTAA